MEQMTAMDASFFYAEMPKSPMHIGGMMIYDPSSVKGEAQRFKNILDFVAERLHLAKTFRQRMVAIPFNLSHPYWIEDADFDLEYHMRHIRLPEPGDWRQLCIQAARLHSRPLDLTKPLWEFTVVEGLDAIPHLPKGSYAIISKIHHACIDGVSAADITEVIHSLEPYPELPPPPKIPWRGETVPQALELVTRAQLSNMLQPFKLLEVMARAVPAISRFQSGFLSKKFEVNMRVPRTRFSGPVCAHRVIEGRSFQLDELRHIKQQVPGATINDVVLSICSGALRAYLNEKAELPDTSLVAMAPISVRSETEKNALGNQVSAMTVKLGTDIGDPVKRLEAVHQSAASSKDMINAVGAKLMTDFSQFIPSTTAALAARLYTRLGLANSISAPFNCVISNVPGPQFPLYSAGATLVTQYGFGPIFDGMGLIFPIFSYNGQLTISIVSCRTMVPDPGFFAECLQQSYDDLRAAVD